MINQRIDNLIKEQKSILKKAMLFVKPGGRLLYCSCSLVPAEGENIIKKIFDNNDKWKQTVIDGNNLGVKPEWIDSLGGLRLRPTRIEFWHDGEFRLHDRFIFEKTTNAETWKITRLNP